MNRLKGFMEHTGVFSKLVILFGIICCFVLVLTPLTAFITAANPTDANAMKVSQLILSIGIFVLPPFILAYLCSHKPLEYLRIDKRIQWSTAGFIVLFMIVLIPFINLLGDLNHKLVLPKVLAGFENWMKSAEDQAAKLEENMLQVHGCVALFFNVFLIALLPAFGEELFFRGALLRIFQDWKGFKTAIWIIAFIFSAIHLQFYGFVPRMLLGAFFGYLLFWSENIWYAIIAHFTNNAIAVIFYYLKFNGSKLPDIDSVGIGNTLWLGIASGAIGLFGLFWLKRRFQVQQEQFHI